MHQCWLMERYSVKSCDETIYLDSNYWQKFAVLEEPGNSVDPYAVAVPFLLIVTLWLWQYRLCYRLKIFEQNQVVTLHGTPLNACKMCIYSAY